MITLQGAKEKSPILLLQYCKNEWLDGTIIISYFGGSNNIFAECILLGFNQGFGSVTFYLADLEHLCTTTIRIPLKIYQVWNAKEYEFINDNSDNTNLEYLLSKLRFGKIYCFVEI